MAQVQIRPFSEIETAADMHQWIKDNRKLCEFLGQHWGAAAGEVKAMLKEYDTWSGQRGRAARVARPLGVAAVTQALVGKFLATCMARFLTHYEQELRGWKPRDGRTMRMGG